MSNLVRSYALLLASVIYGACSGDTPTQRAPDPSTDDDDTEAADDDADDDTSDDDAPESEKKDAGAVDASRMRIDAGGSSGILDANVTSNSDGGGKGDASSRGESDASRSVDDDRPKPKCMKKDSQLIIIGDSYINWPLTHTFPEDMAAESGQRWRMYAVGGYSMATGGTGLIPPTFDAAIRADADAHTVLMDGGGNDLLLGDSLRQCRDQNAPTIAACQKIIADALAAADKLMKRMETAGIRDVIYFFYPHVPANTVLGGANPNAMLDYALPMVRSFCEGAKERSQGKLHCTFVDMVPVFEGKPQAQWFFPGDIHPTPVGSKAMAKEIWRVMSDKCIAQKGPKDCCEQ